MPDTRLFRLQKFSLTQEHSALRIGTDAVLLGCSVDLNKAADSIRILDIGTGCGIILLMLAQKALEAGYRQIELTGIDIDSGSIADARTNAELFAQSFGFTATLSSTGNGSNDLSYSKHIENCPEGTTRLEIHLDCISLQEFAKKSSDRYNLIVSNPPFFINSLKSSGNEERIAKHNDTLPQKDLAQGIEKLLAPGGSCHVILPPAEAQQFLKLLTKESPLLLKSTLAFKTTNAKPAKRLVLHFQNCGNQQTLSEPQAERVNTMGKHEFTIAVENDESKEPKEREMVMMRSGEDGKGPSATSSKKEAFTEEYLSFVKDFLLY